MFLSHSSKLLSFANSLSGIISTDERFAYDSSQPAILDVIWTIHCMGIGKKHKKQPGLPLPTGKPGLENSIAENPETAISFSVQSSPDTCL
jgi:hypothetical protein